MIHVFHRVSNDTDQQHGLEKRGSTTSGNVLGGTLDHLRILVTVERWGEQLGDVADHLNIK